MNIIAKIGASSSSARTFRHAQHTTKYPIFKDSFTIVTPKYYPSD